MNESKNSKCSCMGFFKCAKNTKKDYSAAANQVIPGSHGSENRDPRAGRRQNANGSRS